MKSLTNTLILILGLGSVSLAQVQLLKQKQINASLTNPNLSISAPVGNERLMVLLISNEYINSTNYDVTGVTYGGVTMSKAGEYAATSLLGRNEIEVYFLTDSMIQSATDSSINVTYNLLSLASISEANYTAMFFSNVEQSNPIFGFTGNALTNTNNVASTDAIAASTNDGILELVNSSETNAVFSPNGAFSTVVSQNDIATSKTIGWQDVATTSGVTPSASSTNTATRVAFAAFAINNSHGVALPIKMTSVHGEHTDYGVELSWTTLSETNNDYFIIERSLNFIHWEEVGTEQGAGNSNAKVNYHFTDAHAENVGMYYRITQVDYNGDVTTFKPVFVAERSEHDASIFVYPNPANTVLNVNGGSNNLRVFDLCGVEMPVPHNFQSIDVSHLKNGFYVLVVGEESLKFNVAH